MLSVRLALPVALLSVVIGGRALGQEKGPNPTPLIPRAALFGNPDRAGAQLSHDGKWLSYLAPLEGVMNVWVAPVGEVSKAKAVTHESKRGVRQYRWAYDNAHVLYLQDAGGDENWKIYSVGLDGGAAKDLTPFEEIKGADGKAIMQPNGKPLRPAARLVEMNEAFPTTVVVGLNNRNPQYHDVYKLDIATGKLELVKQNDEYAGFVVDHDYRVRFANKQTKDGGVEWVRFGDDGKAQPFDTVPFADGSGTEMHGLDRAGGVLYVTDSRGRDTAGLFARDLKTGKSTLLAEDARADVGGMIVHPTEGTVQAAAFPYERVEWKVLDQRIAPDMAYLKTVADGEFTVVSRTDDDERWLVNYVVDDGPARTYLYERGRMTTGKEAAPGRATFLFTNRSALEKVALSKMHPVTITSRDGLKLVSYLTLPAWADKDGRTEQPLPMVLLVHGGPWARDSWGFNGYHQWLANRGYAVLSVNYRGSTGFGKAFVNAADGEWAAKMHDDLIDAVEWAVKSGVAARSKVAIMGGSYGGYATLVGMTFTPDVFACGVDIVGPSNLVTLLNNIPPYWMPELPNLTRRVGDFRTEEGRKLLESRSPLTLAEKIKRPLLIGQGANDPRVKQVEADQIVSAMQRKNIPVTYVLFPDEGHGFQRPPNSMAFNAITEAFLAGNLGGRAEAIGGDVEKSTAEVRVGVEGVPGLSGVVGKK